jgi:hypothetical protein
MSPIETEAAPPRGGKPLGEVDALQAKHEAEFKILVPSIAEALEQAIVMQSLSFSVTSCGSAPSYDMSPSTQELPGEPSQEMPLSAQQSSSPPRSVIYNCVTQPPVKLITYVKRIADFTFISPATLVVAVILMERLLDLRRDISLTDLNVHKLFLTATRVASKVIDLKALNNANFSKVCGVSNEHLNDLECAFLMDLEFNVFVSAKQFFGCVCKFSEPTQQVLRKKFSNSSLRSSAAASSTR